MKKNPDKAIIVNGRIHSLVVPETYWEIRGTTKWRNKLIYSIRFWMVLFLFTSSLFAENVNLFWDANTEPDVVRYHIYRGDIAGGPYTIIETIPQTLNPMYSDVGVDLSTDKFYVVTAINIERLESLFSNEVQATSIPPSTPPRAPTITIIITVSP